MILSTQYFSSKLIIFSAWKVADLRTIIYSKTIYAFFFLIGFIISVHFLIPFFEDGILLWKTQDKNTSKRPIHSFWDYTKWKRYLIYVSCVKKLCIFPFAGLRRFWILLSKVLGEIDARSIFFFLVILPLKKACPFSVSCRFLSLISSKRPENGAGEHHIVLPELKHSPTVT